MAGRGMKRPRPGMASRRTAVAHEPHYSAQDNFMPIRSTRSRRSAALPSAATILALVGCSVLLRDMMLPDMDGRYSRILTSIGMSDSHERSSEKQAQIDAFYAKYFGGAVPTTAGGSSTEQSMTVASDGAEVASDGAEVIEATSQAEEGINLNTSDITDSLENTNVETEEQSDLERHDEITVIASTDSGDQTSKVEKQTNSNTIISSLSTDPYTTTRFCPPVSEPAVPSALAPQYKCGENADQSSPRTEYSSSSRKEYDDWSLMAQILARMATKFGERVTKEREIEEARVSPMNMPTGLRGGTVSSDVATRKRPIIFLGDGIIEAYLGTSYGQPSVSAEREAIVQNFAATFSKSKYTPLVQAIEGDMAQHLLYRLQNGALHPGYASDPTAVYVVLIGTANLSAGHLPQETARGILAVIQRLMDDVAGRVLLLQPLPRGDASTTLAKLCPTPFGGPRCAKEDGQPLKAYKPDLDKVRYALENAMATLTHRYPGRIHLLQKCAQAFWPTEEGRARGEEVNYDLMMEDGWHPNAEGHEAIGRCLLDCIEDGIC